MWVWFLAALCQLERRVVAELGLSDVHDLHAGFTTAAIMHAALELSHGLTSTERRHIKDQLTGLAACGFVEHQCDNDGVSVWRITDEGRARTRHIVEAVVALNPIVGGTA